MPTNMSDLEAAVPTEDGTQSDEGIQPKLSESDDFQGNAGDRAAEGEIPEEYMGFRLADYPDEVASQLYDDLQKASRVVDSRFEELATARKEFESQQRQTAQQPAPEEEPQEWTDEELLDAYGIDTSILQYEEVGKPFARLVAELHEMKSEFQNSRQASEAEKWQATYFTNLDKLQGQYGKLPYEKADLERYAVENNLLSPDALYWSIMGPIKAQGATSALGKGGRQNAQAKLKQQIRNPQRRSTSAKATTQPGKPTSLKEAFENAKQVHDVVGDPFRWENE